MSSKTCFKCKMVKAMEAFYRHSEMADGHLNKCIECTKKDVAEHRAKNLEKVREYDRKRGSLPHRVELRYQIVKRWAEQHPDRDKAQNLLNNAVRDKRIAKIDVCFHCGATGRIEAHHPDYSKPLDVVWLCIPCHRQTHAMAKRIELQKAA